MKTLMIVEDEAAASQALVRFFESCGFRTHTIGSGLEAIAQLAPIRPDYLLLDLLLPDMFGLDVLSIMRQRDPQLRVVIVTALQDPALAQQALSLGALDYITKPLVLDHPSLARAFFASEE